jgi:hypothetical protein
VNVLVIVVAIGSGIAVQLAAAGRLARNGILGIRTASVRRDDASWRRGHRAAVIPTWATVATTSGFEAVGVTLGDSEMATVLSWVGVGVLFSGSVAAAIVASRAARKGR